MGKKRPKGRPKNFQKNGGANVENLLMKLKKAKGGKRSDAKKKKKGGE